MSTIANALADRASAATEKRQAARKAQFEMLRKGLASQVTSGTKGTGVILPGTAVANADGSITITLPAPKDTDLRVHDKSDCVTYSVDFRSPVQMRVGEYLAPFAASRPMVLNVFIGDPCGEPVQVAA
jgi:hypothetical protein